MNVRAFIRKKYDWVCVFLKKNYDVVRECGSLGLAIIVHVVLLIVFVFVSFAVLQPEPKTMTVSLTKGDPDVAGMPRMEIKPAVLPTPTFKEIAPPKPATMSFTKERPKISITDPFSKAPASQAERSKIAAVTRGMRNSLNKGTLFGGSKVIEHAFVGELYELPVGTQKLPKQWSGISLGTIYTRELNVATQDFMIGFPGVSDRFEWFGIEYTGEFYIDKQGVYTWKGSSDDGMSLHIDGDLIINNDGIHGDRVRIGKCKLAKGKHKIMVKYFQGPRMHVALRLWVATPSNPGDFKIFDMEEYQE